MLRSASVIQTSKNNFVHFARLVS